MNDWVQVSLVDPRDTDQTLRILVLADWSPSDTTGFVPIIETLEQVMSIEKIDLMIITGDISYDLDSNNGKTYTAFMVFA
jgi:3',5'-cyclic AMP phosphodiesterase CpdA